MGLFDTLCIKCPWCNEEKSTDVKPGMMRTFRFGENPFRDMEFRGHYKCHCGKSFDVDFETIPKMVVKKYEEEAT